LAAVTCVKTLSSDVEHNMAAGTGVHQTPLAQMPPRVSRQVARTAAFGQERLNEVAMRAISS
jgi:hypothetical protein